MAGTSGYFLRELIIGISLFKELIQFITYIQFCEHKQRVHSPLLAAESLQLRRTVFAALSEKTVIDIGLCMMFVLQSIPELGLTLMINYLYE